MATFFRTLGVLFLCFAVFVFVAWGLSIVLVDPLAVAFHGANAYFVPCAAGFMSALVIWWGANR